MWTNWQRLVWIGLSLLCSASLQANAATKARLIEAAAPAFPAAAVQRKLTGWVTVSYGISDAGAVVEPKVVDHCAWEVLRHTSRDCEGQPSDVFDDAAIRAVLRYRYRPATDDAGNPVSSRRRANVRFALDPPSSAILSPLYAGKEQKLHSSTPRHMGMPKDAAERLAKDRERIRSGKPKPIKRALRSLEGMLAAAPTPYARAVVLIAIARGNRAVGEPDAAIAAIERAIELNTGHNPTEIAVLGSAIALYVERDWVRVADLIDRYHVVSGQLTIEGLLLKSLALMETGRTDAVNREVTAAQRLETGDRDLQNLLTTVGHATEQQKTQALWGAREFLVDLVRSGGDYLPILKVQPVYPRYALKAGLSGWVIVEFTVTREGEVRDVHVVNNCASSIPFSDQPCSDSPDNVFDTSAMKAARAFRFRPRRLNGEAVEVPGVLHKITYEILH